MKQICFLVFCTASISAGGCSSLIDVTTDQQSLSKNAVAFTDASTRGIYTFDRNRDNIDYRVCVEPSPDVLVDLEESVTAAVEASFGKGAETSIAPSIEQGSTRDADTIDRTVAISAFRDIVAQACMANAQGIITDRSYANFLRASIASMVGLLAIDTMGNSFKPSAGATFEQAQLMSDMAQLAMVSALMTDEKQEQEMSELFQHLFRIRLEIMAKRGGVPVP